MPDHLHLLLEGVREDADLRRCMKLARQRSAVVYRGCAQRALWQEGLYERVLRDEESTADVVKYIVANPVRAGLVERVADYPFSGSDVCELRDL
jgi:REP element-mobilizing transposase RayT